MHARPERRPLRRVGRSRHDQRTAGRATNGQTSMALGQRLDRGKIDLVVFADSFGGKITRQGGTAAWAFVGMMIDDAIGMLAHGTAVTFMTRLGAAGLCLVPTLLAITRRRVFSGRCIRSTRSISSSFVRRSKSPRSMFPGIQRLLPLTRPG